MSAQMLQAQAVLDTMLDRFTECLVLPMRHHPRLPKPAKGLSA